VAQGADAAGQSHLAGKSLRGNASPKPLQTLRREQMGALQQPHVLVLQRLFLVAQPGLGLPEHPALLVRHHSPEKFTTPPAKQTAFRGSNNERCRGARQIPLIQPKIHSRPRSLPARPRRRATPTRKRGLSQWQT